MKIVIFDLETTGLPRKPDTLTEMRNFTNAENIFPITRQINPNDYVPRGEPIQMSAIVCDFNMQSIEKFISFYCMPTEPISDGAYRIHGISNSEIKSLSGGRYLEDYLFDDYKDIFLSKGNIFMSYNIEFDKNVLLDTLEGYSVPIDMGSTITSLDNLNENKNYNLCLMKAFSALKGILGINNGRRWTKLEEALRLLNYDKLDVVYNNCIKRFNLDKSNGFHSADYDTVAAWILLNKLRAYL